MLRRILIAFGWIIPVVAAVLFVTNVYSHVKFGAHSSQTQMQIWLTVLRSAGGFFQDLVLSPLCFFGAYMLGQSVEVST
jgi:hypothetical protein